MYLYLSCEVNCSRARALFFFLHPSAFVKAWRHVKHTTSSPFSQHNNFQILCWITWFVVAVCYYSNESLACLNTTVTGNGCNTYASPVYSYLSAQLCSIIYHSTVYVVDKYVKPWCCQVFFFFIIYLCINPVCDYYQHSHYIRLSVGGLLQNLSCAEETGFMSHFQVFNNTVWSWQPCSESWPCAKQAQCGLYVLIVVQWGFVPRRLSKKSWLADGQIIDWRLPSCFCQRWSMKYSKQHGCIQT